MVVLITNAKPRMVERFLDTNLSRKHLAWIGMAHGETTVCLEDSEYSIESGTTCVGIEFIKIHSEDDNFIIYNGEYDTVIME